MFVHCLSQFVNPHDVCDVQVWVNHDRSELFFIPAHNLETVPKYLVYCCIVILFYIVLASECYVHNYMKH